MIACPFCDLIGSGEAEHRNAHAVAFADRYPVSAGHTLVVPREHHTDFLEIDGAARAAVWALVDDVTTALVQRHSPDGFNIGINVGEAAGQTVVHAHVHVIPRYLGDAVDPRGGVRWVLPGRAKYWR